MMQFRFIGLLCGALVLGGCVAANDYSSRGGDSSKKLVVPSEMDETLIGDHYPIPR